MEPKVKTTPAERATLLDAVARALGASMTRREQAGWHNWIAVRMDDGPLALFLHHHDDRAGDYLHVSVDWPRDHAGNLITGRDAEYNASNPEMRVSAAKTPEVIAREIRRRLLPLALPLYAKAAKVCSDRAAYSARIAANYRALAAAAGSVAGNDGRREEGWRIACLPEGVTLRHVSDDTVRLEIEVTVAQACTYLAERHAAEATTTPKEQHA